MSASSIALAYQPAADLPAPASDNDSEIIVTGSRLRNEAVQSTPIAVSVVGRRQIDDLHGSDIRALGSLIPNLNITDVPVAPGLAGISLRGFSSRNSDIAVEPGIAVYIDGIYQNITTNSLTGLFDLDKLEVLRGPQGTLLGKNAAAGALLLTRSRPTGELGVKAEVEYGSFNLFQAQGLLNFPIIDGVLSGKLFANYRRRGGFVDNLAVGGDNGDERRGTVRGAILLTPNDKLEVYASMDYQWNRSDQFPAREVSPSNALGCIVFQACGLGLGRRSVTFATNLVRPKSNDYSGVINAQLEVGAVKLSAITGYRKLLSTNNTDADGTPFPIIEVLDQDTKLRKFSQELRLSSMDGGGLDMDGRLAWLIAAYYDKSTSSLDQGTIAFGGTSGQNQRIVRDSKAVFGQIEYEIIERLKVTFGARRSWDKTTHDYSLAMPTLATPPLAFTQSAKFRNSSFEAGANYKFDDSKMVYFRFAEGYRGGGFIGFPTSVATALSYNPETSTSYEAGLKTEWLDGALLFNVTLFDVRFKDLQRSVELQGPNNTYVQVTRNAASATTKGIEIESVIRPTRDFTVRANLGYLDAKYNSFLSVDRVTGAPVDLSGRPLISAPKYTAGVSADYGVDLGSNIAGFNKLNFHANVDYKSSIEYSEISDPAGHQPAYTTVDGSVSMLSDAGYSVDFYVKNAFDKRYITYGDNIAGLFSYAFDDIGRTFGVALKLNF